MKCLKLCTCAKLYARGCHHELVTFLEVSIQLQERRFENFDIYSDNVEIECEITYCLPNFYIRRQARDATRS